MATSRMARALAVSAGLLAVTLSCVPQAPWPGIAKIGLVAPFSGYDGQTAVAALSAMKSVLNEANLDHGARGARFELVALDDQNEPSIATARARELARDPEVVAAVIRVGGRTPGLLPELQPYGLPAFLVGGPALTDASIELRLLCPDAFAEGRFVAGYARNRGYARPALLVADGLGYKAAGDAFRETVGSSPPLIQLPADRVGTASPSTAAAALAKRVAEIEADFVFYSGPYPAGVAFARELAGLSSSPVLLGSDADTPSLLKLAPTKNVRYLSSCRSHRDGQTETNAGGRDAQQPGARAAKIADEVTRIAVNALRGTGGGSQPRRAAVASAMDRAAYADDIRLFGVGDD